MALLMYAGSRCCVDCPEVPCIAVLVALRLLVFVSLVCFSVSLFAAACNQLPYVSTKHEHASTMDGS